MFNQFLLEAQNISLIRGERLLFKHLNFCVSNGEIWQLKGANGKGKTSLLRCICGILEPDTGAIQFNGHNTLSFSSDLHQNSLYLGHQIGIKSKMTVFENLMLYLGLRGLPNQTEAKQVHSAIGAVGLSGFEHEFACHLSQGQQRRIAIARLLLEPASLWLLDEPFVALDIGAKAWLVELIEQHVEKGGGVIFTSHEEIRFDQKVKEITLD